ncbi:MAG: STAS domain-containing protein [Clostridia bacterium]|nr:STAS domain-containing protein [Clostridia bacterium]
MTYTYDVNKQKLKVILDEEIDVNSCKTLRTIIDGYIMKYSPKVCELDLEKVPFMDSSGIGFIAGRQNLAKMLDCKFVLINANTNIKRIMQMYEKAKGSA